MTNIPYEGTRASTAKQVGKSIKNSHAHKQYSHAKPPSVQVNGWNEYIQNLTKQKKYFQKQKQRWIRGSYSRDQHQAAMLVGRLLQPTDIKLGPELEVERVVCCCCTKYWF